MAIYSLIGVNTDQHLDLVWRKETQSIVYTALKRQKHQKEKQQDISGHGAESKCCTPSTSTTLETKTDLKEKVPFQIQGNNFCVPGRPWRPEFLPHPWNRNSPGTNKWLACRVEGGEKNTWANFPEWQPYGLSSQDEFNISTLWLALHSESKPSDPQQSSPFSLETVIRFP